MRYWKVTANVESVYKGETWVLGYVTREVFADETFADELKANCGNPKWVRKHFDLEGYGKNATLDVKAVSYTEYTEAEHNRRIEKAKEWHRMNFRAGNITQAELDAEVATLDAVAYVW